MGFIKDIVVAYTVRILGLVSGLLMSVILTNSLTVAQAGLFFLSLSVVSFLVPIGLLGLNTVLLRFVGGHYKDAEWGLLNTVVYLIWKKTSKALILITIVLFLGAEFVSVIFFKNVNLSGSLSILSLAIFFIGMNILIAYQFQAINKTVVSVFLLSVSTPVVVSVMMLLNENSDSISVSYFYMLGSCVTMLWGLLLWRRVQESRSIIKDNVNQFLRGSDSLWFIIIMNQMVQWGSLLIAGAWVSPEQFAYLTVAQRVAMLVSFILIAVNMVVAPRYARLYKEGKLAEIKHLSQRSIIFMSIIALPMVLVVIIYSDLILIFFGSEFIAASALLIVLSIGQFFNVITGSVSYLLTMTNNEKDLKNIVIFTGVGSIVLALILVPVFGVMGAAISTSITVVLQNVFAVYVVKKRLGFNTLDIWS